MYPRIFVFLEFWFQSTYEILGRGRVRREFDIKKPDHVYAWKAHDPSYKSQHSNPNFAHCITHTFATPGKTQEWISSEIARVALWFWCHAQGLATNHHHGEGTGFRDDAGIDRYYRVIKVGLTQRQFDHLQQFTGWHSLVLEAQEVQRKGP